MHGYMGKILYVNLSNSELTNLPTQSFAEQYLGGRGIGTKIYWETVKPEFKAFDPENRLILMTGPLVATGAQGATRMSVIGKSPMTYPEGFCYGNIGGFFPAELKRAGYDGIVFKGRATRPVYLWIQDNQAELRDASFLWGKGAYQVEALLQKAHGEKVRYLTTGVAGEKMVRTSILFGSHDSASTGGYGAVMGSKYLKAVAVIGSGRPSVADPEKLKELNRYTVRINKRVHRICPQVIMTGHGDDLEVIGKGKCAQCGMRCMRTKFRYKNGKEVIRKCQAQEYYLPWRYGREDEPVDTFCDAPTLANDYSICTLELGTMIDWLYACYQSNALTEEETGLPLSRIGTREFLEKLVRAIAFREGFGDIPADGLVRARERLSSKAQALLPPTLVSIGLGDTSARLKVAHSLLVTMDPREHRPLLHHLSNVHFVVNYLEILHPDQADKCNLNEEAFRAIAKAFWGSEEAADVSTYEGKALAAKKTQDKMCVLDSLGLCDFTWPITYSFNTSDFIGDPDLEAKIFSAVTGKSGKEIDRYGESIFQLQRLIQLREGRKVPDADFPPDYMFTETLDTVGFSGVYTDQEENMLDRAKFDEMLKEYYRLRGWDETTGRTLA